MKLGRVIGSLIVMLSLTSSVVSAKTSSVEPALKLTQTHYYFGDTETIVSMHGVRINNKGRMRFSLVAKSPDWKITIFRDDDRTFTTKSLKDFETTGLVTEMLVKKQPEILAGGGAIHNGEFRGTPIKTVRFDRTEFDYLPLSKIAAPETEAIIYASYRQPTNGGITLKYMKTLRGVDGMTGLDTTGNVRVYLKTKKLEQVTVPKDLFEPPSGYKKCNFVQEVLLSKVSRDASGDFDELFEINNPSKGKHK